MASVNDTSTWSYFRNGPKILTAGIERNFGPTIARTCLLANSPAVVIGAMLLAPLMGPVISTAFGTVMGDTEIFEESAKLRISEKSKINGVIHYEEIIGNKKYFYFNLPMLEIPTR